MSFDEAGSALQKDLMFHILHDDNSQDPFRNSCFERINNLFSGYQSTEGASSVFLRNSEDVEIYLKNLPSAYLNLGINSDIGEKEIILTRERVSDMWVFWQDSLEVRDRSRAYYGNLNKQIRRFSLHMSVLNALEQFLHSEQKYLMVFEDDSWVVDDFPSIVTYVLGSLPDNWDVFNFVVPENDKHWFTPNLQVKDTNLSIGYQTWSAASILFSRVGARKVLSRYVFEFNKFEIGDPNGDMNLDNLICNFQFTPPFDIEQLNFKTSFLPDRYFQNYTFLPDFPAPIVQNLEVSSTWQ